MIPRTLFVGIGRSRVAWYRCALPAMALGQDWVGVQGTPPEVGFATGLTARPIARADVETYDVVVLQQPMGREWLREIRRLQRAGVTVLIETDDDVHAIRKTRGHGSAGHYTRERVQGFELTLRAADGVICSTERLARRAQRFNPRTWVCRNGVDLKRYALEPAPRRDGTVTLGWAGGTGHADALEPWLPAVASVLELRPQARFTTIGMAYADRLAERFPGRCLSIPWAPLEAYPAAMTAFDVALAPAAPTSFFRAKSDLRWLEASALGVPTVAEPVVYPGIEPGVTGFYATTPDEARELLLALVDDAALRRRVGEAARAHVREHRSIEVAAQQWAAALAAAVPSPVAA